MSRTTKKPAKAANTVPKSGGIGRLLAIVLRLIVVAAAGVGGWFGVDYLTLASAEPLPLPELGDGLPTERLNEPEPWRRFQLTYIQPDYEEHYWFDLDAWMIRSQVVTPERTDTAEIYDDVWYSRAGADGEWVEQDPTTTRTIANFAMGGVGPFLLTDLVPPDTLGFTTLELEGTSKGERVYEVVVDAAMLKQQHPLAFNRWVTTTRILGDGSAVFRIRVRPDGYILRIDNGDAAAIWTDLPGGVVFESPLAARVAQNSVDPTSATTIVPDPAAPQPSDSVPTDSNPVDPAPVDPAPVDPAPVDPAPVDPAPADPATEPTPTEPAPTEPAPAEPPPSIAASD